MEARKPRHHSMPMTCKDKLERVFSGEIRQTIRRGERYQVGDTLTIFEWTGIPYRSKWGRRIEGTVNFVGTMSVYKEGVTLHDTIHGGIAPISWDNCYLDGISEKDGLNPPTGIRLKEVLFSLHPECDFEKGEMFQVVRW